jgi:hypothetical protein
MLNSRLTAVFPSKDAAESTLRDLRAQGISDDKLAIITQAEQTAASAGVGATEGLLAGAGVGALFGLAAALIPGVGPFIAAGFLAPALGAVGGGAAAGAIVGGTAGLIAGALARAGYPTEQADFLGKELEKGQVLLVVDTGAAIADTAVTTIIAQHGGRVYNPTNTTNPYAPF